MFGLGGVVYDSVEDARGNTYTTSADEYPPTRLVIPENPFNADVLSAKTVIDFGCGTGRNLPWVMENTAAHYVGIEPNPSMRDYFWEVQDHKYKDRVSVISDFSEYTFDAADVIISTFVLMHLGYRAPHGVMNITDITQELIKLGKEGTVWVMFEHEREERWQDRWFYENNVSPDVYIKSYRGWPELLHRGLDHNLIIWKQTYT